MDLQKIHVRQDLSRMVLNYLLMGKITEDQADKITDFIDSTIGGGNPYTETKPQGKVYFFPGEWRGTAQPQMKERAAKEPEEPAVYFAPYGETLPSNIPDFREALQRDGLVLIKWEKYTCKEGTLFNVLWCKSYGKRLTSWAGYVREEEIPYVLPGDSERYYYCDSPKHVYTVNVAPDNVLHGAFSEFPGYVQSLKDYGLKNDFSYDFNFAIEKRKNYLKKYKDLIALNLPPRILNILTDAEITTVKELKETLTLKKLRTIPGLGKATIEDTITALKKNNINLQEEESYVM